MARHLLWLGTFIVLVSAGVNVSPAAPLGPLRAALKQHYALSRIEVQNRAYEGAVVERGAVLTVEADAVPAKKLRVIQANTKSPRFHVRDYARVEITDDGEINAGPGDLRLQKGIRLVVLDLKVERDTVRVFTHTAAPVLAQDGTRVYGCTEFVFRFGRMPLAASDAPLVQEVIERWLPFAA